VVAEALRAEVIGHAASSDAPETFVDSPPHPAGEIRAQRDAKRVALVGTAPKLPSMALNVEDHDALG
jgi:hypothetical protein